MTELKSTYFSVQGMFLNPDKTTNIHTYNPSNGKTENVQSFKNVLRGTRS